MGGFSTSGFNRGAFGRAVSAEEVEPPVLEVGTGLGRRHTRSPFTHRPQVTGSRSIATLSTAFSATVPIATVSGASCEVETLDLDGYEAFATISRGLLEPTAFDWTVSLISSTGSALTEDSFSAYQAFEFDTATGGYMSAPTYEDVLDLTQLKLKSITIRRSATDKMWGFSTEVSGATDPDISLYPMVIVRATDHLGVDHVLFSGFTPDIARTYQAVRSSTVIGGYDHSWYLSHQYVPRSMLTIPASTPPHETVEALIEGTKLQPYRIQTVSGWGSTIESRQFAVESKTTKQTLIDAICDAAKMVFFTKPAPTGAFPPAVYFVREDLVDNPYAGLDLPPMVTVRNPDPYLISPIRHASAGDENYNRVIIRGSNENGQWFEAVVESPGVTAGDDPAIEYLEESIEYDTQAKCQNRALELYLYFSTRPVTYTAVFRDRVDLQLYQLMRFVGFTDVPDDLMRIVEIKYKLEPLKKTVTVTLAKVAAMKTYDKLLKKTSGNTTTVIETITRAVVEQQPSFKLGTITAISGNFATVKLDMGGTIVARIP